MRRNAAFGSVRALASVTLLALAACTQGEQTTAPDATPLLDIQDGPLTDGALQVEYTKLCKEGSAADFEVSRTYVSPSPKAGESKTISVHLEDGQCKVIAQHDGLVETFDLTVTEVSTATGFVLDRIEVLSDAGTDVLTGTNTVTRRVPPRHVITFFNEPEGIGRMTGGGHQIRIDQVRITRGFTIHCDIVLSNNLEINWIGGNKWHIDKPLTSAQCFDDPNVNPEPPRAPFDTFVGEGLGSLNGVDGSLVKFVFVDAGEPGSNDTAWIRIWAPGADPSVDTPVLEVSGNLDGGNLQAHFDQPHK